MDFYDIYLQRVSLHDSTLLETSLIKTHAADIKLRVNHFLVIRVISAAFIRHLDVFVASREEGVGDILYSDVPPT